MKLLPISILFFAYSFASCSTQKQIKHREFSSIFLSVVNRYDTCIVYSEPSDSGTNYRVIGLKNNKYTFFRNFTNDSTVSNVCNKCKSALKEIVDEGLFTLPDESELKSPCRKYIDTVINQKTITEVRDLEAIADIPKYRIEFKYGVKMGRISYKSPSIALGLCPESGERRAFGKIISIIKELNSNIRIDQ